MNWRLLFLSVVFFASCASAQNTGIGTPPFGSFTTGTQNDIINTQNLNVHFIASMSAQTGRGPLNFQFAEINDSQMWIPVTSGTTKSWAPVLDAYGHQSFGWQTGMPTGNISSKLTVTGQCRDSSTNFLLTTSTQNNFVFVDPQGTSHPFPTVSASFTADASGFCASGGTTSGYAGDASGYYIEVNPAGDANPEVTVHSPTGMQYLMRVRAVDFTGKTFTENIVKDPNGNFITGASDGTWTNTDGHAWRGNINPVDGTAFLDSGNLDYEGVTVTLETIPIQTNFGCPGVAEYSGTATVPEVITLGSGTRYTFNYELTPGSTTTYTGRLRAVTLPTGGDYLYTYQGANDGINCADGTTMNLTRTIGDASGNHVWTFSRNGNTTTITAPQLSYHSVGNDTVLTFDANGHEISRKIYQGSASSGTLLSTTNTTWATNGTPATVTAILEDGRTQSENDTTYNSNGVLQSASFYDFGNGARGPLIKTAIYTHLADSDNNYAAPRNLISLLSEVQIKDPAGVIQSRTHMYYDEAPLNACTASLNQHDDNFGCSFPDRGNLTSALSYRDPVTPASPIVRSTTYDIFGNVDTVSVNGVQQKSYTYDALYTNPVTTVDGPANGPQLTTVTSYTGFPARPSSIKDPNGLTTSFSDDSFGRFTTITRPDGSQVSSSYDDLDHRVTVTSPIDSTHNVQTVTQYDDLGRVLTTLIQDPGGNILNVVQNQYDALGRLSGRSNPYTGTRIPPFTTNSQFDALGRVTKTILPDGQQITNAYSLQTVTTTDPTGKQVRKKIDSLGRVVEVDLPGGTASPATAGSGSATITGAERSVSGAAAAPSTGSVTMSGTERSTQVLTHVATSGSASFTVNGTEQSVTITTGGGTGCKPPMPCCISAFGCGRATARAPWLRFIMAPSAAPVFFTTIYDQGTVTMTVNGFTVQVPYGSTSTGSTIATALAGGFNVASSPVNAVASGAGLTVTAKATGAATNYAVSYSSATTDTTGNFTTPSFSISGPTALSGGTDNAYTTVYDTGGVTVKITANGTIYSKTSNYGQTSTPSTIASDLANQINADAVMKTIVTASASTNVLNLTTVATGSNTTYGLTASAATNNSNFAAGSTSFTSTASGSMLTGGANAGSTVYDTGTVSLTVNGVTVSASYGSTSTSASIASALASALNNSTAGARVTVSGSTINMVAGSVGPASNYTMSTTAATNQPANFTGTSFSASLSGAAFTGGANAVAQSLATPTVTNYTYNVLDEVTNVTRGQQSLAYSYNALGWITSMTTPEIAPGAVSVVYNDLGLKTQTTDPRGVTTSFGYDTLNRLTSVTYNTGTTGVPGTSNIAFSYGTDPTALNNGKLVTILDGTGSETYTYDNMGRKIQCDKGVNGVTYTTKYQYNFAGELTQMTYPSGRQLTQDYDGFGRMATLADSFNAVNTTYATGFSYNVAQQTTQFTYGNGVAANYGYSSDGRQQLTSLQFLKGTQRLFGVNYGYLQNGGNNGEMTSLTDLVDPGRTMSYVYDGLGQLQQAYSNGSSSFPKWDLAFAYDPYGNRTDENTQPDSSPNVSLPSNHIQFSSTANTNKIITAGYAYDAAGNMTDDGLNSLVYDAANNLVSVNSGAATYYYDGNGLRVRKCGSSCSTSSTVYIFSGGSVIAEYDNGAAVGSPSREYINLAGVKLAKIEAGATQYYLMDHLSVRALADSSGNKIGDRGDFPFGEQWYATGTGTKFQFTSYERDSNDTGNDYAMARYSINRLGRFNAVDPVVSTASLNRYAYSGNDPINQADPTGMLCIGMKVTPFDTCANSGLSDSGLSMSCVLDGVPTSCGEVLGAIDRGEAGQCPNNVCRPGALLGTDGNWYSYVYHPATLTYLWLPNPSYDPLKFGDPNNEMFIPGVRLDTGGWSLDKNTTADATPPWLSFLNSLATKPWYASAWIPIRPGIGWAPSVAIDPNRGVGCISLLSGGFGAKVAGGSIGPLLWGDTQHAPEILSGLSMAITGQVKPFPTPMSNVPTGGQAIWNQLTLKPQLAGPSWGTPGVTFTVGYGWCANLPRF